MPDPAAEGARPLRPGYGGADREPGPPRGARPCRIEASLPRLRRGSLRHDPGGEAAEPKTGAEIWVEPFAADRSRRSRARALRRRLACRAEQRNAAASARKPNLLCPRLQVGDQQAREELSGRLPADGKLA